MNKLLPLLLALCGTTLLAAENPDIAQEILAM
jgi:hypothetical protein